ncbi:tyrosinase family protein, partial [Methylobacterium platani]
MSTSRRTVLLQGGVIGAGLIAGHLPGAAALAAQAGPPLRRSLQGLAWNDPIVATYRDAVGIMKRKPASDPLSWVQLAGIHGSLDTGFRYCPHGNWYFLPWHRAFTTMYERIVRHLTRNDDFALPYWDWTTNPLMPAVFLDEKTPDGKPNWLCVTDPGMKRTWNRTTPMPADICGRAVLTEVLNATPYEVFGTGRPRGQNSLDPSWVTTRTGVQGRLEATPHNLIHNNIGGWMPSPASPRDPIFFMHHGNIDRIWTVWNLRHANSADPLWTGMTFKDNFRNPDGTFWSPKVSDLFVPEELGYTYGTPPRPAATAAARTLSLPDTLSTVLSAPPTGGSPGQDLAVASVENSKAATPAAPLTLTVPVPEASLRAVRGRVPVGSGLETMDFTAAQERAVSGTRALAILRDV